MTIRSVWYRKYIRSYMKAYRRNLKLIVAVECWCRRRGQTILT